MKKTWLLILVICLPLVITLGASVLASPYPVFAPFVWPAATVFLVLFIRYGVLGSLLRSHLPAAITAGAMWRTAVVATIFILGLPAIFIVLATAGGNRSAVIELVTTMSSSGSSVVSILQGLSVVGIPALVVAWPEYLRTKGRAAASSLVPAWLAGFASVLTGIYIVTLHFYEPGTAGLGKSPLGIWSVAAFGASVLLAPFYRAVAKACLRQGVVVAFDPAQWWSAWCVAYGEMRGTSAAAAEAEKQNRAEAAPNQ
jgi:hypothetical protein